MPCKIYLRHDQSILQRQRFSSEKVTIFAPSWVQSALNFLGERLNGTKFELFENGKSSNPLESFTITKDFNNQSLTILQRIARNESHNVSGVINTTLYPDIADRGILYSIRDIVRQCVIVGVDQCSFYGGYRCNRNSQPKQRVYVCDLAALQFQQAYNSGRLVLIQEGEQHSGVLDDLVYEKVVGEKKRSFSEVQQSWGEHDNESDKLKKRYIRHDGYGLPGRGSCFFDTKAYASFVKHDVILYGLALQKMVSVHHPKDKIHFKFLKYGTGFFAWKFAQILDELILPAVLDGLEELLGKPEMSAIKKIELPFYECRPCDAKRLENFQSKFAIEVIFSANDALKQSFSKEGLIVSTTNCGDSHAVCGNEMQFGSVDAAVAENLESKGNIFCPNINLSITEQYISF
ncbi:uncharacterized protein LOC119080465 [Bradysia coprophila]|uniref:uncharacterized protein LOC119080465 n=1 Tax=Bradysia coprophila TaxID=38358 RepID=UPI00187D723C|nr:uncharacterized protein LOC119080465 [Bradysia coprophila]